MHVDSNKRKKRKKRKKKEKIYTCLSLDRHIPARTVCTTTARCPRRTESTFLLDREPVKSQSPVDGRIRNNEDRNIWIKSNKNGLKEE